MRDDVGRRELAGAARAAAKARLDLAEETGVEEYLLVRRAVERPHRRLRHAAAAAIGGVAKQHDARPGVILSAGLEDLAPAVVDLAENAGDHAADFVLRRAGLGRPRLAIGLVGRRLVAAGEDFGAADQDARIDAEGIADQAEHDDGADAEPAAAHRQAKTAAAAAHSAAAVVATVIDVVAAAEIIVTHGGVSSSPGCLLEYPTQQSRKISIPLINNPPGKNCLVRPTPQFLSAISSQQQYRLSRFLLCRVNVSPVGCLVPRRRQRRLSQSN